MGVRGPAVSAAEFDEIARLLCSGMSVDEVVEASRRCAATVRGVRRRSGGMAAGAAAAGLTR